MSPHQPSWDIVPYRVSGAAADQSCDTRHFQIGGFSILVHQQPRRSASLAPHAPRVHGVHGAPDGDGAYGAGGPMPARDEERALRDELGPEAAGLPASAPVRAGGQRVWSLWYISITKLRQLREYLVCWQSDSQSSIPWCLAGT
jgi:hypothetical protein